MPNEFAFATYFILLYVWLICLISCKRKKSKINLLSLARISLRWLHQKQLLQNRIIFNIFSFHINVCLFFLKFSSSICFFSSASSEENRKKIIALFFLCLPQKERNKLQVNRSTLYFIVRTRTCSPPRRMRESERGDGGEEKTLLFW